MNLYNKTLFFFPSHISFAWICFHGWCLHYFEVTNCSLVQMLPSWKKYEICSPQSQCFTSTPMPINQFYQSINQSVNQSTNPSINQSVNQSSAELLIGLMSHLPIPYLAWIPLSPNPFWSYLVNPFNLWLSSPTVFFFYRSSYCEMML